MMNNLTLRKSFMIFWCMCLLNETETQTIAQPDVVYVEYCPSDFECILICGSYSAASSSCSCHPACRLFGDCCYNHQEYSSFCPLGQNEGNLLSEALSQYEDHFKCNFDVITKERYWMVSICPESWDGPNKCDEARDNNTFTVGRLEKGLSTIPVVSIDGVTFTNIYCAVCHGKDPTKLTPWSFEADGCADTDTFDTSSTIREKVTYLVENCEKVSFLPPKDHLHHSLSVIPCRQVEYDVIDTCNNTEMFETITNNCSTIAAPVEVNGKQFKNKFCVNCYYATQDNIEVEISEACVLDYASYSYHSYGDEYSFVDYPSTYPAAGSRPCFYDYETGNEICPSPRPLPPPLVPISITFNFGGQNGGVSVSKEGNNVETISFLCNDGQVFDPLESKCIQLTCPDGYQLTENLCVEIPTIDNNTTVSCERFALDITLRLFNTSNFTCSSSVELFDCLPQDLALAYEKSPQHNTVSCHMKPDSSNIKVQVYTRSIDVISKLLSTFDATHSPKNPSLICNTFGFVEILAYCNSLQSNATLDCQSEMLNDTQWYLKENSTDEIVIKNTTETISVSEIKIQHNLGFSDDSGILTTENISIMQCTISHVAKSSCPLITLDSSLFKPEVNDSGILIYSQNNTVRFTPDMYNLLQNGSIQVCSFLQSTGYVMYIFFPEYSRLEAILSTAGISVSIICLSFTLITYGVFPTLRSNLANILIMTLCACLLLAQILLIFAGVAAASPLLCSVVTGLGHFLWLSVFTTSSMLGLTLNQTFSMRNQAVLTTKPSRTTVICFLLICFGVPSVISGILLLLYMIDDNRFGISYGSRGGCWIGRETVNLFAFGIPVAICLVVNLVFFLHVTVSICIQTRNSGRMRKNKEHNHLREVLIYVKIFMILGLTWIIGFAAAFTDVQFLWYLFIILTSLQGVFIFLAFTVKSQIWKLWAKQLGITASYSSTSSLQSRVVHSEHGKHSSKETANTSV